MKRPVYGYVVNNINPDFEECTNPPKYTGVTLLPTLSRILEYTNRTEYLDNISRV